MAASRNFESDCRHFDPRLSAAIQGLLELSSVQLELSQPKYIALYQALTSALGAFGVCIKAHWKRARRIGSVADWRRTGTRHITPSGRSFKSECNRRALSMEMCQNPAVASII
jgi:hypothetical protein